MASLKLKPNNIVHLNRDRGYRFIDRDKDLEWICNEITRSGLSVGDILEKILDISNNSVHISYACVNNWLNGTTKRPQNFTLTWVANALGYSRGWTKI